MSDRDTAATEEFNKLVYQISRPSSPDAPDRRREANDTQAGFLCDEICETYTSKVPYSLREKYDMYIDESSKNPTEKVTKVKETWKAYTDGTETVLKGFVEGEKRDIASAQAAGKELSEADKSKKFYERYIPWMNTEEAKTMARHRFSLESALAGTSDELFEVKSNMMGDAAKRVNRLR